MCRERAVRRGDLKVQPHLMLERIARLPATAPNAPIPGRLPMSASV